MARFSFLPVLLLIAVAAIVIVNPLGNFPLNDDWAFARSVWWLLEDGMLKLDDWPDMSLIGQVLWGGLFCKIFGLSHFVLRCSTLTAGMAGAYALYLIAMQLTADRRVAAFVSLLLLFSPVYFSLSFTFMTDVHFTATMLFAVYFFIKYLKEQRMLFLVVASVFSAAAAMIRQPGMLIPLAFVLAGLAATRNITAILKNGLPLLFTAIVMLAFYAWTKFSATSVESVGQVGDLWTFIQKQNLAHWFRRISQSMMYVGLFLVPLMVLLSNEIKPVFTKIFGIITVVCALLTGFFINEPVFPIGNILYNLGLGPKVLKDTYQYQNIHPQLPGLTFKVILKTLAAAGIFLMLMLLSRKYIFRPYRMKHSFFRQAKFFLLLLAIIYGVFLVAVPGYFDRYFLPLFAVLGMSAIPYRPKIKAGTAVPALLLLVFFSLFSIAATHDYLSWNRTRWKALDYLMNEKGVSANDIDGGFEFNGWLKPTNIIGNPGKSWWFVDNDDYVIAFGDIGGFSKYKGFHYTQMLSFHADSIYILTKNPSP
jgi:4-amino-4-deoxy-L-arabinose transferase-like glycosyltransferase